MTPAGCALIVEDEAIIAFALEDLLLDLGFSTVRLASTVSDARGMLEQQLPDFAVLDVNIQGELSYGLADILRSAGIPFVFATGYGNAVHPPHLFEVPTLKKPYTRDALSAAITAAER